ncbi:MAG: hypothetical protein V4561_07410 [Bacteroidota bacterium]
MFVLNIPEPCHQNWDDMTPEKKGRFCGSCQKIVVDFTQMSDEQVKHYLLDSRNKNTCGRFLASQIGRPFENQAISINEHWYFQLPVSKQIFYAVALFFVLGVSSCDFSENTMGSAGSTKMDSVTTIKLMAGKDTINKTDTAHPPKVNIINHPGPILTGDVIITEPAPVRELQGAPIWQEEPIIDTTKGIVGKIAAPLPQEIDSIKVPEPMIMGGIAVPTPEIKDSTTNIKKPRR